MTDGIFKRNDPHAHARATEIMSTKSETDFEWSVKLIGDEWFYVGIASQLLRNDSWIWTYDQNAIHYFSNCNSPVIRIGSNNIYKNLPKQKTGDVIHLRFEPQRKKLVIHLVRI